MFGWDTANSKLKVLFTVILYSTSTDWLSSCQGTVLGSGDSTLNEKDEVFAPREKVFWRWNNIQCQVLLPNDVGGAVKLGGSTEVQTQTQQPWLLTWSSCMLLIHNYRIWWSTKGMSHCVEMYFHMKPPKETEQKPVSHNSPGFKVIF